VPDETTSEDPLAEQPRQTWWHRILWWRGDAIEEDEPRGEGGRTWKQVTGYGERVLEPGRDAAEEEAASAERIESPDPDTEP
jgi:hypothetical protein